MEIDASRTALLLVHWQVDVVKPEGAFGAFFAAMVESEGLVPRLERLAREARATGIPIVYVRACYRPDYPDLLVNNSFFGLIREKGALLDGHPGAEVIPELAPQPG